VQSGGGGAKLCTPKAPSTIESGINFSVNFVLSKVDRYLGVQCRERVKDRIVRNWKFLIEKFYTNFISKVRMRLYLLVQSYTES
jgi:hypothetical protein